MLYLFDLRLKQLEGELGKNGIHYGEIKLPEACERLKPLTNYFHKIDKKVFILYIPNDELVATHHSFNYPFQEWNGTGGSK